MTIHQEDDVYWTVLDENITFPQLMRKATLFARQVGCRRKEVLVVANNFKLMLWVCTEVSDS